MATKMIEFLLLASVIAGCGAEELSEFIVVFPYKDFSSTSIFRHDVPTNSKQATWTFQADRQSPDHCGHETVTIVLQHGSLPVINPLGEKVPDNFFLDQISNTQKFFKVSSNNVTVEVNLNNPKSGPWYGAAYLPKSDGKLRPADLFVKCVYQLRHWFSVTAQPTINVIEFGDDFTVNVPAQGTALYKFKIPLQVYEYNITVHQCSHGSETDCSVSIATRAQALPNNGNTTTRTVCSDGEPCRLEVSQAGTGVWSYLQITSGSNDSFTATVTVTTKECSIAVPGEDVPAATACLLSSLLDKHTYWHKFHNRFQYISNGRSEDVIVTMVQGPVSVLPFHILDGEDNGGSLSVTAQLLLDAVSIQKNNNNNVSVEIELCLQRDVKPLAGDTPWCSDGHLGNISQGQATFKVIVPYPREGYWFVGLMMKYEQQGVSSNTSKGELIAFGEAEQKVNVTVTTNACVDGGCSEHGRCTNYLNGHVLFTTCSCESDWRGFDCSDGTEVQSAREQLLELLLLILSNLCFIPAIVLASYRRHYVEALYYAYTMVFSGTYHACDGGRNPEFTWCVLPMDVLAICDFMGSASSIWITLIAMSRPPLQWKAFVQTLGPLGILVGVVYRRSSAYLFFIPAGLGILLLIISWVCRCCYRGKCYPNKWKYLLCILPGALLAIGGLCIFAFLEDHDNYMYTHSAWHACMALSICFLLPPRDSRVYKVKNPGNGAPLGSTYQPINTNNSNYVI